MGTVHRSRLSDDLFEALSDRHRRRLLVALLERDPGAELAIPGAIECRGDDPDTVHVELVHSHLPKLEEMGYIDWERDGQTVARGPRFERIRPFLRAIYDHREELPADWIYRH